jgi:hypothetical protein
MMENHSFDNPTRSSRTSIATGETFRRESTPEARTLGMSLMSRVTDEREDTMNLGKAQSAGFIEEPVEEPVQLVEEPVAESSTEQREEQPALTQ